MSAPLKNVTGLILAGGRSSRMGGQDKGLMMLDGRTFVEHLVSLIRIQVDSVLINANRNHDTYRQTGYPVVGDTMDDFQGPLAGMLAGLKAMNTPWLLTLPCDGPFVAADYASRMMMYATGNRHALAVASDGNRLQPVYALIHTSIVDSLEDFLSTGNRKIDRWFQLHDFSEVSFSDQEDMFINVNTPEDLAALESI